MKFTGENLTHVGFYVKAKLSVNQRGTGGKRVNKGAVPDVEKPNDPADGFFLFCFWFSNGCLPNRHVPYCPKERGFNLLSNSLSKLSSSSKNGSNDRNKKHDLQLNSVQDKDLILLVTKI